jgi:NADPH-dependent curcumin reductase CurA
MRRVALKQRPDGEPVAGDFEVLEDALPRLGQNEVLVAARFLSIDPYVRTMIDADNPYGAPMPLGQTITGDMAGEVVASSNPDYAVGSWAAGRLGWASHGFDDGSRLRPLDPALGELPLHLALFGSSGLTAYFGMLELGRPRPGDQVLVSGAAGAVGQVAGQIAKAVGARVVGIAGGQTKCGHLVEVLGFDGAIDHRAGEIPAALDQRFPDGIDVYYDNIGGPITDAVMARLAHRARVVVCGESSQYDAIGHEYRPSILGPLMDSRATMSGLLVSDFSHRYDEGRAALAALHRDGRLKVEFDIIDGLDYAAAALIGMLKGENTGKRLVRI